MLISREHSILILGYGVSGKSAYRYLKSHGYNVFVYDDVSTADVDDADVCRDIDSIDIVVKSPSIKIMPHNAHWMIDRAFCVGSTVISTLDLFYELLVKPHQAKIIAITGTNGKSTVTSMVYHVMRHAGYDVCLGGNIGVPYFDLKKAEYYVLEISSYELASSCRAHFDIGVVTNLADDHLDFHGTFDNYVRAKHKIFDMSDCGIVNTRDIITCNQYKNNKNIHFSDASSNDDFAAVICSKLGLNESKAKEYLFDFQGLDHRAQVVAMQDKIIFVNDSKATNPHASCNALNMIDGDIYLMVGGRSKNIDPIPFVKQYIHKLKHVYCFGEAYDEMYNYFQHYVDARKCYDMRACVRMAYLDALNDGHEDSKKTILLSPMCASFDMFKNFEDRGNAFIESVSQLINNTWG